MNTKIQQATDFDLHPPIELHKYDESIRQFCAAYGTDVFYGILIFTVNA